MHLACLAIDWKKDHLQNGTFSIFWPVKGAAHTRLQYSLAADQVQQYSYLVRRMSSAFYAAACTASFDKPNFIWLERNRNIPVAFLWELMQCNSDAAWELPLVH